MSKKMNNIILIVFVLFLCNIGNVGAKEVVKECKYKTPSSVTTDQQTNVLCSIYDDESHTCYMEVGDKEATTSSSKLQFNNWKYSAFNSLSNKELVNNPNFTVENNYHETGDCPKYIVATIDKGFLSNYNIFGLNDLHDAEFKKTLLGGQTVVILNLLNLSESDEKQQLADMKSSLEMLKNNYNFYTCSKYDMNTAKNVFNNLQNDCLPTVLFSLENIALYKNQLQQLINNGLVETTDSTVVEINSLISELETHFSNESKSLRRMMDALSSNVSLAESLKVYEGRYERPESSTGEAGNCTLFGANVTPIIKWIIDLVHIAVPVIIIVLTIIDFVGVVLSGEDKNFKTAGSKLVKRLLIGAAIIFLPMLLTFIIDLSGALVPYGIGRDELFCSLF